MPNTNLNEREFELINIIGAQLSLSQRDLSEHLNQSLGNTNMLLRRLISKGYIRMRQLNKRKVEYILTPKGFAEKMRKSVRYTLKTIHSIGIIKENLKPIMISLFEKGERNFIVLGKSDFAMLVEMVFSEMNFSGYHIQYVDELPATFNGGVLLICKEEVDVSIFPKDKVVDLIHELAKDERLVSFKGEQG